MKDPTTVASRFLDEKRKNTENDDPSKCARIRDIVSVYRPEETTNSSPQIGTSCGSLDLNTLASSFDWDSTTSSASNRYSRSDPLRQWKEMKENGFLSPSHSLLLQSAVLSSARSRSKKKTHQKKMKTETRKDLDAKCQPSSSPSGLLSGLNVGIINHVRNKRQVHSIIKALVSSDAVNEGTTKSPATPQADEEDKESIDVSLKAANVAAQWLELLNQDINGRLSALRQSRSRVTAAITTELPRLFANEECSDQFHVFRWENLFSEMESALSKEEKQLECWLCDVREMQMQLGSSENCTDRDKELAVMAAAASIYSSSNFLMSNENASCFLSSH